MRALHGKKISSSVSKGRLLSAGKLSIYGERRERTTTISRLLLRAALAWLLATPPNGELARRLL